MSIAPITLIADAGTRERSTETPANEPETKRPGDHRRQIGRLLLRLLGTSYRDSLFERPDLIEDDYYRFINQPRGW